MSTLSELRKTQEEQVEALRKLQWNKTAAPIERKELIQQEIDALQSKIQALDSAIQNLINESKATNRR
jgi:hypothetical protein